MFTFAVVPYIFLKLQIRSDKLTTLLYYVTIDLITAVKCIVVQACDLEWWICFSLILIFETVSHFRPSQIFADKGGQLSLPELVPYGTSLLALPAIIRPVANIIKNFKA